MSLGAAGACVRANGGGTATGASTGGQWGDAWQQGGALEGAACIGMAQQQAVCAQAPPHLGWQQGAATSAGVAMSAQGGSVQQGAATSTGVAVGALGGVQEGGGGVAECCSPDPTFGPSHGESAESLEWVPATQVRGWSCSLCVCMCVCVRVCAFF